MLLAEIHCRGFEIPPLLLAPWVDKAIFRPDWLHAADLGVTPRFLGNLFWHGIADRTHHYLRGASQKARSQDLWRRFIQPFYEEIKQLKARYARACDDNYDADTIAELFTDDAVWDGGMMGYAETRDGIRRFFENASSIVGFAVHGISNPLIERSAAC